MNNKQDSTLQATILVIDETPDRLHSLMSLLTQQGHQIHLATSDEHALAVMVAQPPDLILVNVSIISGQNWAFYEQLQKDRRMQHVPIIGISPDDQNIPNIKALSDRIVDYITLSFTGEELCFRLNMHLTNYQVQQHLRQENEQLRQAHQACQEDYQQLEKEMARRTAKLQETINNQKYIQLDLSVHQAELESQNIELRETQAQLELSHQNYQRLYDFAPVGYFTLNHQGLILELNLMGTRLLDRERRYVLNSPLMGYLFSESRSQFYHHLREVIQTGLPQICELQLSRFDGSIIDIELVSHYLPINSEENNQIFTAMVDITARKQAERELTAYRWQLEEMVEKRTAELVNVNEQLQQEITERKQAEDALRASEQRLRSIFERTPVGMCITDEQGYFELVNPAYTQIYEYQPAELIGKHFTIVVPLNQRPLLSRLHDEFIVGKSEIRGEWGVETKTKKQLTILGDAALITGTDGRPKKVTFVIDISRRKQMEETLKRRVNELTTLNSIAQTLATVLDLPTGLENVARLTGQLFEAQGVAISLYNFAQAEMTFVAHYNRLQQGAAQKLTGQTIQLDRESLTFKQVLQARQAIIIPQAQTHPLTEPVREIIRVRDVECLMVVPMLAIGQIIGGINISTNQPQRIFTSNEISLAQTVANQIAGAIETARLFDEERTQRRLAESLRHVAMVINSSLDLNTVLVKIVEQLKQVIHYEWCGLFLLEDDSLVLSPGPGISEDKVGLRLPLDCQHLGVVAFQEKQPQVVADVQSLADNQETCFDDDALVRAWMSVPLLVGDKAIGILIVNCHEIGSYDEDDAQLVQIFANQAAIAIENARLFNEVQQAKAATEMANEMLSLLANIDGLTQIANRRRFDVFFEESREQAIEKQQPLSLILCDIDYFKRYNDTYGHQAGDECLQYVAQAIRVVINRPRYLVARYGGEEFGVILCNTDESQAMKVAHSIQQEVKQLKLKHEQSHVSHLVTLSMGLSTMLPQQPVSLDQLISQADAALYEAKNRGRNQIVSYQQIRKPEQ